ncbi:YgjP-like metallopeptidase domain-containing protein [Nocardiopsis sp. NPDC006832]|uniref:YgjP-like metallopeptidase domain-containing protein n=1 Tax=Nocardiopsis sp. NPDC006832 TaxID=3157188 RepID=UPI0033FA4872
MPATLNTHPPERLHLEELVFSVRVSSRRKTAGITVDRDGSLIPHVPEDIECARVQEWVRRKRHWVRDKLADKDVLISRRPRREFVSGEGFDYLGRRYRLKVTDQVPGVHFNGARQRSPTGRIFGVDPVE